MFWNKGCRYLPEFVADLPLGICHILPSKIIAMYYTEILFWMGCK